MPPRPFIEKYKSMRLNMSRAEVDALLAEYPSKERREERDKDDLDHPMPRPCVLTVVYDEKLGAIEGDHVIKALFDTAGRLVGKDINEYMR